MSTIGGGQPEQAEHDIAASFVVVEDSLRVRYWADDRTSDTLWDDLWTRTKLLGNGAFIKDEWFLQGPPDPAMEMTGLILGALGAGGAVKMLVQILRDWVLRYRIKSLKVLLPDGTTIEMADTSIESVERLITALSPQHTAAAAIPEPDTAGETAGQPDPTSSE
ncbi:hypothetical protein ACIP5Y_25715 [Nocardia sp. NPDC088792]|uniref:hypothetical protein n=1 Tax=Nocardia sp. NPDC088792 TaxID=3364332 RepID=UPI00381AB0C2